MARGLGGLDSPPPALPLVDSEAAAKSAIDRLVAWTNGLRREPPRPQPHAAPPATLNEVVNDRRTICQKVLRILHTAGTATQDKPRPYAGEDGEALCEHFLTVLQSHYS